MKKSAETLLLAAAVAVAGLVVTFAWAMSGLTLSDEAYEHPLYFALGLSAIIWVVCKETRGKGGVNAKDSAGRGGA
jgi:hypothetical protein